MEMYSNNSFPILFIIIVKRGNMMRNKEDNIVKWLYGGGGRNANLDHDRCITCSDYCSGDGVNWEEW